MMPAHVCQNRACLKVFVPRPHSAGKYCSRSCAGGGRWGNRPPRVCVCETCSKTFVVPGTHNEKNGPRRFCSNHCKNVGYSRREVAGMVAVGKDPADARPPQRRQRPRQCAVCQNPTATRKRKYCSDECLWYSRTKLPMPRRCPECGDVLKPWKRLCETCREYHKRVRRRNLDKLARRRNLNIGRVLISLFPDLREIVTSETDGYSGRAREEKRRQAIIKIGTEGAKMFNLNQRAIQ